MITEIDRQNHKVSLTYRSRPVKLVLLDQKGNMLEKFDSESIYASIVRKAIGHLMWRISNRRIA